MATRDGVAAAAPTRHLEVETKLELDPAIPLPNLHRGRTLAAAGITGVRPPVLHELDALYFDTDQLDLLRSRITLRRRTGGDDSGWHIKLPAAAGARTEVALPLTADSDGVPAVLAELVTGAARGRRLRPVARIRNNRTVHRLTGTDGAAVVEVADDQVLATAVDADGAAVAGSESSWREVEAELLAGTREQLSATVTVLIKAGAAPASAASKLARALGNPGAAAAKAKRRRTTTAGEVVVQALTRARDAMITTDRALREGTQTALHDARAAARRARSVVRVYRRLFELEWADHLADELREHGQVLSTARDLQVIAGRLERQLVDEPAEFAVAANRRLTAEFDRRLPAARAEVDRHLRSASYFQLLRDLDSFIDAPPLAVRAQRPAVSELPLHLDAAWRRLKTLGDGVLTDPDRAADAHEARKRAKELRYAAEAAGTALGEEAVVFAAAVEQVQEVLGEHQDAVTSAALLAELAGAPDTDGEAGFVFGRLHAFEQATAHGALDDFADAWDRVSDGELLAELTRG